MPVCREEQEATFNQEKKGNRARAVKCKTYPTVSAGGWAACGASEELSTTGSPTLAAVAGCGCAGACCGLVGAALLGAALAPSFSLSAYVSGTVGAAGSAGFCITSSGGRLWFSQFPAVLIP